VFHISTEIQQYVDSETSLIPTAVTQNISLKSIYNLLISLTHRQTDSQSGLHNPLALIPGINYILCLFTVCDATHNHNNNSSISNDNNNNNSNYDNNKTAKSSSFVTVQLSDELSLAVPLWPAPVSPVVALKWSYSLHCCRCCVLNQDAYHLCMKQAW